MKLLHQEEYVENPSVVEGEEDEVQPQFLIRLDQIEVVVLQKDIDLVNQLPGTHVQILEGSDFHVEKLQENDQTFTEVVVRANRMEDLQQVQNQALVLLDGLLLEIALHPLRDVLSVQDDLIRNPLNQRAHQFPTKSTLLGMLGVGVDQGEKLVHFFEVFVLVRHTIHRRGLFPLGAAEGEDSFVLEFDMGVEGGVALILFLAAAFEAHLH